MQIQSKITDKFQFSLLEKSSPPPNKNSNIVQNIVHIRTKIPCFYLPHWLRDWS